MFDGIYGHPEVKQMLTGLINNNTVSHAYIFSGAKGVGKTTMAHRFAEGLTQNSIADVISISNEYYKVKKDTKAVSADAVRAARLDMYIKPYIAEKKVFIIPDADLMSPNAQNALLKVLEEPPLYCIIILLAANEKTLLPTIRSRAVTVRFAPLSDDTVSQYIKDKYNKECNNIIIRLASGSITVTDEILSDESVYDSVLEYASIFKRFIGHEKQCIYEAMAMFESKKETVGFFFAIMTIMLSDLLLQRENSINAEMADINKGAALKIVDKIEKAKRAIGQSRNYSIVISELLLEAWRALHD